MTIGTFVHGPLRSVGQRRARPNRQRYNHVAALAILQAAGFDIIDLESVVSSPLFDLDSFRPQDLKDGALGDVARLSDLPAGSSLSGQRDNFSS